MGLFEDGDLFPKPRAISAISDIDLPCPGIMITYVPGFWSVKGVMETSWTFISAKTWGGELSKRNGGEVEVEVGYGINTLDSRLM